MQTSRLGDILVKNNIISSEQLTVALQEQKMSGGQSKLGSILVKHGLVKEPDLVAFLSRQYGVPTIALSDYDIDPAVIKIIPAEVVQKYNLVPVNRAGSTLIVAVSDPSNLFAIEDIKFMTSYNVEMVVTSESDIRGAIDKYYDQSASLADVMDNLDMEDLELVDTDDEVDLSSLEKATEDAPVVKLVNLILMDAIKRKASDIHVEPYEKTFRVRYRIDGVLYEVMKPPMKLKNAITSRIKIMAELDISERRLPQDGRIKIKLGGGKDMDYRVSCLPTLFGEKIVLRLLDKSNLQTDLTKLGYEPEALAYFQREIHKPFGMVLVTGPTDAPANINRLLNMGIEPFLVASAVNLITAQRLARRVCGECKEKEDIPLQALIDAGVPTNEAQEYICYKGRGCPVCNNTGYKGRVGFYQVMPMLEPIRELILNGANTAEIKRESMRLGIKTMRQSGLTKVKEGITSLEEVLRVTVSDD